MLRRFRPGWHKVSGMTSPLAHTAPSFPRFMDALSRRQGPALLWYSVPGERIELSGRVLDNWVAKTANLLVDECELEPNQLVVMPQRLHWRSFIIALAALRVGARVTFQQEHGAHIFTTFNPQECSKTDAEHVLVLASEPLAPRFPRELPDGALDYAAEVRSHPDVYTGFSEPTPQGSAWEGVSYQELMRRTGLQAQALNTEIGNSSAALHLRGQVFDIENLQQALSTLAAGYALLILDPQAGWTEERISRVSGDEQAQPYPNQQTVVNRS